ncbi:methyltransferase family protein [Pseudaminobacter salicylatoxidans]|uniref:Methyltransferase family protein n=1 Tax=Pseudaminobacter salicylatoxidans TaxID=93369 RepID=A0A316BNB2_PSESE|nr:class I SAM-dependent methyltransferase [Pseudaminobacter salicylatoxidans]PWJ74460.1 methyltransferase family protein [Pseudaminobacter salicylatoxidans]
MSVEEADEDRLYSDPDLVQFYDLENECGDDFDFCLRLAQGARSVLDLGCGTGQLAAALSPGRAVVGVDPAGAMLDVARARPGGNDVAWIEADAREVRLDRAFDLIVLTGHAFQVFLTPADRKAVLETIARHLAPHGRFIFDSRNPALERWRSWTPEQSMRVVAHPRFGDVEAWNDVRQDPATGIVTYETFYRMREAGRTLSARSQIAFPPREEIETLMGEVGLVADKWLGDWRGAPYAPSMREIIPIGRLR